MMKEENWQSIFNAQLAMLVFCLKSSEQKQIVLEPYENEAKHELTSTVEHISIERPLQIDQYHLKLLEPIISSNPNLGLNLLWNRLICPQNINNEPKHEIINRLHQKQVHMNDVKLVFEIINLEQPVFEQTNNLLIKKELKLEIDETGKKIKLPIEQQIQDALKQNLEDDMKQPDCQVITAFLYLIYKLKLASAAQIDDIQKSLQTKLIHQAEVKFRQALMKVQQAINEDGIDPVIQEAEPDTSMNDTASTYSVNKQQSLLVMSKYMNQREKQPQNMISIAHQTAIQEFMAQQMPDFSAVLFQKKTFKTDEDFMLGLLDSGNQTSVRNPTVTRASQLICLAEFLLKRNEKFFAHHAILIAQDMLQSVQQDLINQQMVRIMFCKIRRYLLEERADEANDLFEKIKQNEHGAAINMRMRNSPAYGFLRAQCYQQLSKYAAENEKMVIKQEISRYIFQSLIQLQKVKEFDDLQRGSTNLAETGFFDLEYGYQILEMSIFNSQILLKDTPLKSKYSIAQLADEEDDSPDFQKQPLGSLGSVSFSQHLAQHLLQPPMTATDFLKATNSFHIHQVAEEVEEGNFLPQNQNNVQNILPKPSPKANIINELQERKRALVSQSSKQHLRQETSAQESTQVSAQTQKNVLRLAESGPIIQIRASTTQKQLTTTAKLVEQIQNQNETEKSEKDVQKQTVTLAASARTLLENFPTFGPNWSVYSLIQLAMGNSYEARLSSSLSTLMNGHQIECWTSWFACELMSGQSEQRRDELKQQFCIQLEAMGSREGYWGKIWDAAVGE
ncbi:Conserved_hypothetical protein [Hexamita inflata]|uniref:Uncharacterized protein n=2 Tax=Hexamita inflata TaxID=28002 RepID=A0ABP1HE84_9EUKA